MKITNLAAIAAVLVAGASAIGFSPVTSAMAAERTTIWEPGDSIRRHFGDGAVRNARVRDCRESPTGLCLGQAAILTMNQNVTRVRITARNGEVFTVDFKSGGAFETRTDQRGKITSGSWRVRRP
jgi:hypothetical protein